MDFLRSRRRLSLLAALLLVVLGCERPFVDVATPDITVLSPDLSIATSSAQIDLVIDAVSFRDVVRVAVNGVDMARNSTASGWVSSVPLSGGLNEMIVEAFDRENVASLDTLYALRIDFGVALPPAQLPTGRGGHTATTLSSGAVIVAGGAYTTDVFASDEIFRFDPNASSVRPGDRMTSPRVGHTASLLPDGRILIVGGAVHPVIDDAGALVESTEIYDPVSDETLALGFRGSPIHRAFHTADIRVVAGATILDVYGGVDEIGIRDDIRSFELKDDSLIALSPAVGGRLVGPVWGHTQTALNPTAVSPTRYLIVDEEFAFTIDFSDPRGLVPRSVPLPSLVRSRHAAVPLGPDLVGIFGGRFEDGTLSRSIDIYSDRARRFFRVPVSTFALANRYAHRVSRIGSGGLLVTGGFSDAGNGIAASEMIVISFPD